MIGSPSAARTWGALLAPGQGRVEDVVVFGGGQVGAAIARTLSEQGIGVRLIEPRLERAREVAEQLPECRVYNATGIDADFLERERIGRAQAAVFAIREDAMNHYAATLARVHGVRFTIAVVHDTISTEVYELSGVDVTVNPRGCHRGGDRAVRARPADAAGRDARGQPLRGPRHHHPADERVRRAPVPGDADPRRADRRDRARRQGAVPPERRGPRRRGTA